MRKVNSSLQNKAKGLVIFIAFNTLTMFAPVLHAQTSPYYKYDIKDADTTYKAWGFAPKRAHSKAELAEIMQNGDESQLTPGISIDLLRKMDVVTLKHYRDEAGGWPVVNANGDTVNTAIAATDIPWFIENSVESDQVLPELHTIRVELDLITPTTYTRHTYADEHTLWFNPNLIPGIIPNPMDQTGKYNLVPWKSLFCCNPFIVKSRQQALADDGVIPPLPPSPVIQNQTVQPAPQAQVMQAPPVPVVQAQADAGFRIQWGVSYGYSPQIAYATVPYQQTQNCCAGNSYSHSSSYDDHSIYEVTHTTTNTITNNIVIHQDTTIVVVNDSTGSGWPQDGNGGVDTLGNGNGGVDTTGNGDTPLDGGKNHVIKDTHVAQATSPSNEVRPTQNVPKKEEVKATQTLASVSVKTQPSVESSIYAPKPQLIKTSVLGETPKTQVKNNTEAAVIHPITPKQITNNSDVVVTPKSNVGIKNDYGFNPATVVGGIKNPVKGTGEIQNSSIGNITPSTGKPNVYANTGVGTIDGPSKQPITKANSAIGSIDLANNPYVTPSPKTTASKPGVGGIRNETVANSNIGSIKTETVSNTNVGGIKNVRTDVAPGVGSIKTETAVPAGNVGGIRNTTYTQPVKGVGSISDSAYPSSVGSIPNTTASAGRPAKGIPASDSRVGSIR